MSVTIVSCVYGNRGYHRFIGEWAHSVQSLEQRPDSVIVLADRNYDIPCAHVFCTPRCSWRHPQAYYLHQAVSLAATEWVWILDIDDAAAPNALDGIEHVDADVWQMGYLRSDGERHVPPQLTGDEYLSLPGNPFTAGSAFRAEAFRRAGGFPDIAFQDWGLWRRLARAGATFESSGRVHYRYNLHDGSRTASELLADRRTAHLDEMIGVEPVAA